VTTTIQFKLGSWDEMADVFAWDKSLGIRLQDWIAHGLNQTMQRDGLLGGWADVYESPGDNLSVKMSAPFGAVKGYAKMVPAFINAARIGYQTYLANRKTIDQGKLFFWPPIGMTMLATKSVQLLHYPPYEARSFSDYLYSPTNRRWESLLGHNGYDITRVTPLERICDAVPLAGPGSDATYIQKVEPAFYNYGKAMLSALLRASGSRTQPVVAYGGPAHDWLKSVFHSQIKRTPQLFSVYLLKIVPDRALTPVLCANHPSQFLFYEEYGPKWRFDTILQDLVAARWQAEMAEHPDADPVKVLHESQANWQSQRARVHEIVAEQIEVYGDAKSSSTVRNPSSGRTSTAPVLPRVTRLPSHPVET
jgi:hypothetical protein